MSLTLISNVTVGSGGAASIDFTSIPGTYTDLLVVYSLRDAATGGTTNNMIVAFNGVTTNASQRTLRGTGTSAVSSSDTPIYSDQGIDSGLATANTFGNGQIYIPNYAGSTNKSVSIDAVTETNGSGASQVLTAGLWSSTAAINRIELRPNGSTWVQYSSASIYGVTKGSGGATVSP